VVEAVAVVAAWGKCGRDSRRKDRKRDRSLSVAVVDKTEASS
jgi:hypothetical protein